MTPKLKSILIFFQLVVGLGWALGVTWLFLAIAASAEPISRVTVVAYWGAVLVGPIVLIVGSLSLVAPTRHRRMASLLAVLGSLAVSIQSLVWVAPSVGASLGRNQKGLAVLAAGIVGISVLSSLGAYVLYRDEHARDQPASAA
jgi:uncharacterized membrane protein